MKIYGNEKISQLKTLMTFLYSIDSSKMIFMGDELASFDTFSVFEKTTLDTTTNESKVFNKYFKNLTNLYKNENALSNKDSSSKLLDLEGYSIYGFIRECKNDKLLVLINFTDLEYKIKSPYNLEELINTEDLIYDGNGNINGKVNKSDFIKIMPFGSAIFRIK
jgi:1,4-alpha-glucan branching enzyme